MKDLKQTNLKLLQQTIQDKYSNIFHQYKQDFILAFNKIKQSIQNLNLILEIEEKDINGLSLDLLCDVIQLYLVKHTNLSTKEIRRAVYVNLDHLTEFKQDQEQEKLKIQLIFLIPQLLDTEDSKIKELIVFHKKALDDFYNKHDSMKLLNAFMNKVDQATDPASYSRNITIFQSDLNVNKVEFFKFVDSLKWLISDLAETKDNSIDLWSDSSLTQSGDKQYAANIQINNAILSIVKRLSKETKKKEYEAKHFAKNEEPSIKENSSNEPPIINIPDDNEVNQNNNSSQFIWGNDPVKPSNKCSLCSHFDKVTDRPKNLKDSIVINPKGQYQYRICMKTGGQITVILSQPIKYCPQCGRKLN